MEQVQAHERAARLVNEDDLHRSRLTVFEAQTVACSMLLTARYPSLAGGPTT